MINFKYLFLTILIATGCRNLPPDTSESTPESESTTAQMVDEFLQKQTKKGFAGAVMVVENSEPILIKGYGSAQAQKDIPIDENTLFDMGSITKSFTATAILKLVEMGKLQLDDPLTKYFENVSDDKKNITIHHLLTHSAGLPDAIGGDYSTIRTDEFLEKTWQQKLLFPIGESYEYSNVGYTLLGMIIEKTSGESYGNFLQKNIFQPAEMFNTGYTPHGSETKKVAHGIQRNGTDWGSPQEKNWDGDEPFWHLKANGGLLTTAADMAKWYEAVAQNKILQPETLKKQLTGYVDEGGGSFYGYGLVEFIKGKHYAHNGGNGIFRADWNYFPERDAAVFIASNKADVPLFKISENVLDILIKKQMPEDSNMQPIDLQAFPSNNREIAAEKFIQKIQTHNATATEKFIDDHFSKGIVERNGKDRLAKIFGQLQEEFQATELAEASATNTQMLLKLKAPNSPKVMLLHIKFEADKIDSFSVDAEMEN